MQKPCSQHQFVSSALSQSEKKCLHNENKSNHQLCCSELPSHRIQVTPTSWSSTWSLFHSFARITLVQMGLLNSFFGQSLIEFRGSFLWIKKNFSEQFAYTLWLWVPAKACSEPLKGESLPQTSHKHQLVAREGNKGSVLQLSWVLAEGGLVRAGLKRCLLWYSSSQEDPESSGNMIFSYYEHQSASCDHIFLFQKD